MNTRKVDDQYLRVYRRKVLQQAGRTAENGILHRGGCDGSIDRPERNIDTSRLS